MSIQSGKQVCSSPVTRIRGVVPRVRPGQVAEPAGVEPESVMPSPPPLSLAASCPIDARQAFSRILNLRSVAVVFCFCLLFVAARMLPVLYYEPLDEWSLALARSMRQNLISGLLLLPTIALVDAAVVRFGLSRRHAFALAFTAIVLAASIAMVARFAVYGTPLTEINWPYFASVTGLWTVFGGVGYSIFFMLREDEQQRAMLLNADCRSQQLNAQMLQARLSALQAQIEPHFLFNTLANVKRLYETTPDRGRAMLSNLIAYLRAVLPTMRETGSTLGRELELARSFLTILQMRMGERLSFSIDAPRELLSLPMPPMILATLVENAIKHGLSPLPEGGRIDVSARRDRQSLIVAVRDSGAGITASSGSGVGLSNTRSRLAALYGAGATLSLSAAEPHGVVATVHLPIATATHPDVAEAYA
jgi:signal transduction histidine kinase